MDGERGNNEPGIVTGGGLRNAFSRGTGKGGLRNADKKKERIRYITERHDEFDSPDSFGVQAAGSSDRRDRLLVAGLLPCSSSLRPLSRFECGGLA